MLTIYKPKYEDLWFKQLMLSDEDTMSYNHAYGGTILFSKDLWRDWYDKWISNNDNKRFYRYLMNESNEFVGEIAYHFDDEKGIYLLDILIYSKFRKKGYGSISLDMLCSIAKENGINILYDEIAIDNPCINLFLRHGFMEVNRNNKTILVRKLL